MALISLQEISVAFGGPLIFDHLSLQLEMGERVALLGRNGVGKTTLMKVMAGQVEIDGGEIVYQKGTQVTHLPQEVPNNIKGLVFDIVLEGLGKRAKTLADYHHVVHELHTDHSLELLQQLHLLHGDVDDTAAGNVNSEVEDVLAH